MSINNVNQFSDVKYDQNNATVQYSPEQDQVQMSQLQKVYSLFKPKQRKNKVKNKLQDNKLIHALLACVYLSKKPLIIAILILTIERFIYFKYYLTQYIRLETKIYDGLTIMTQNISQEEKSRVYNQMYNDSIKLMFKFVIFKIITKSLDATKALNFCKFKLEFRVHFDQLAIYKYLSQPLPDCQDPKVVISSLYDETMTVAQFFVLFINDMTEAVIVTLSHIKSFKRNTISIICYLVLLVAIPLMYKIENCKHEIMKALRKEIQITKRKISDVQSSAYFIKSNDTVNYEVIQLAKQMYGQFKLIFKHEFYIQMGSCVKSGITQYRNIFTVLVMLKQIKQSGWGITEALFFRQEVENFYDIIINMNMIYTRCMDAIQTFQNLGEYFDLNQEEKLLSPVAQMQKSGSSNQYVITDKFNGYVHYFTIQKLVFVPEMPQKASLQLINIKFQYDQSKPLINGFSHVFLPGLTVIQGTSGCGKTTLFKLLQGFYPLSSGQILLNNQNIQNLSLPELRRRVSIVLQDSKVFKGQTCEQNINYDLERRYVSSEAQQLCQINFISLNDVIVELSGGQSQRISLARGIARSREVLLLDEVTSALDETTEALVLSGIRDFCHRRGIICLMIAHRSACLRAADYIVRMGENESEENQSNISNMKNQTSFTEQQQQSADNDQNQSNNSANEQNVQYTNESSKQYQNDDNNQGNCNTYMQHNKYGSDISQSDTVSTQIPSQFQ